MIDLGAFAIDPVTAIGLASTLGPMLGLSGTAAPGAPAAGGAGGLSGLLAPLQGLGSKLSSLLTGGPGRGQLRRASARDAVAGSPALLRVQAFLDRLPASRTPDQITAALREYLPRDPQAREAMAAIMGRVGQLGGSGKAQGEEANTLGDVLKWVLLHQTVTKLPLPSNQALAAAIVGAPVDASSSTTPIAAAVVGPPVVVPTATLAAAAPASLSEAAQPFAAVRSFVAGTPVSFTPSTTTEAPMGSFLDSLGAALPSLASQFFAPSPAATAPFVLPGGAVAAGAGALAAGLSNLLPSVGLPFVDLAPSGGAALFEPFRRTASGARAQLHIQVNPATDKPEFFAPVGRPLIFSRDFATVKRMKRLGGKMVTATGGRRGTMTRRRRGGR